MSTALATPMAMAVEWGARYGGPHGGGPPWIVGPIFLLLLVALIGTVVWLVVRSTRPRERSGSERARDTLAERFARGEISSEEYRDRLSQL